jgi:hypothetical protein
MSYAFSINVIYEEILVCVQHRNSTKLSHNFAFCILEWFYGWKTWINEIYCHEEEEEEELLFALKP